MKPLRIRILYSLLLLSGAASLGAVEMTGGGYTISKTLVNASGQVSATAGNYELAYAVGEPLAGYALGADPQLVSGYFGGRFGVATGLTLLSHQIGPRTFYQHALQVGVPYDASIRLIFSDPLNMETAEQGIVVRKVYDHLGHTQNVQVLPQISPETNGLLLHPDTPWEGNTLYEVVVTQSLKSAEGLAVEEESRIPFVTLLNPSQENIVLHPLAEGASASPGAGGLFSSGGGLSVRIPTGALPDYAMVRFNDDPVHQPLQVDPHALEEATRKAQSADGPYRTPVSLQEIQALNAQGESMPPLAKAAEVSLAFDVKDGWVKGSEAPVHPETLSLWTLDEQHKLWVKLPDSRLTADGRAMTVAVPHFSVYALMGGPSGSTADVFAFPNPWRPYGPNAGDGAGQTGSVTGGILFSSLPSECTIRLYTLAGDLVRTLHHSDTGTSQSQERWDVRTDGGETVASGVYLWRVESAVDGKNGKIMVIR